MQAPASVQCVCVKCDACHRTHRLPPKARALRRIKRFNGDSVPLLQAAAHLYQAQGQFQLALGILLRLKRPDVFNFVARHGLLGGLKPQQARLDPAKLVTPPSLRSPVAGQMMPPASRCVQPLVHPIALCCVRTAVTRMQGSLGGGRFP